MLGITYVEQPKLAGPTLALKELDGSPRTLSKSEEAIILLLLTMHVALQLLGGRGSYILAAVSSRNYSNLHKTNNTSPVGTLLYCGPFSRLLHERSYLDFVQIIYLTDFCVTTSPVGSATTTWLFTSWLLWGALHKRSDESLWIVRKRRAVWCRCGSRGQRSTKSDIQQYRYSHVKKFKQEISILSYIYNIVYPPARAARAGAHALSFCKFYMVRKLIAVRVNVIWLMT